MGEKFRSALGMSYLIYVSLFISIINKAVQIGLFKEDNLITQIFKKINFESPIGAGSTYSLCKKRIFKILFIQ